MRSPVTKHKSLWLGCLLLVMLCGPVRADASGEITGVTIDPDTGTISMSCSGKVGKHLARVIGHPNRLIMDFADTAAAKVPSKIGVDKTGIHEIRVGSSSSRTRVVVDFQDRPVPAFKVRRQDDQVQVIFGNSMTDQLATAQEPSANAVDPLAPHVVPAAAEAHPADAGAPKPALQAPSAPVVQGASTDNPAAAETRHETVSRDVNRTQYKWLETEARQGQPNEKKLAQAMEVPRQPASSMGATEKRTAPKPRPVARVSTPGQTPAEEAAGRAMVREVRPPVTPPTPDPRLLVQEITELKFVQVGHNARLIIRGGDKLDYRMNNVSPTKLRIDLINAEIPKVHQKPLKTDQFSTSVEMIVPGSQTIFVQLKDSVPAQVEKKKGVLMFDFPPPRFTLVHSREREGGSEASRIIQEEQIKKSIDRLNADIERLQKSQEQLQKQRNEILKAFQVTSDPEIFNKPVTMDFQGISLKNAFRLLAEQAGINIIVNADVAGATTLRLFEVPLGQVIDTIMTTNGLDRVMVGNVMRVGTKGAITQYKQERRKEYLQRIGEVDKRIADNNKEIKDSQQRIEVLLEDLKKLQEAPLEDTRTEEIGEAGCIDIEGEKVCFAYATVRLTYIRPTQVLNTLDCMFNLNCGGARRRGGTANIAVEDQYQQGLANERALAVAGRSDRASYQEYLSQQGFSPDSPGGRRRLQTTDRLQAELERSQAARTTAAGIGAAAAAATARVALPWGEDPKLARIIAYSMLWPDDQNRMIFIKDTPDRIAQMRKLIYTLDVPTPQVLIETRLVRAVKGWSRGIGVIWGAGNNQNGPLQGNSGIGVTPPYDSTYQKRSFWGFGSAGSGTVRNITNGTAAQPQGTPFIPTYLVNIPAVAGFVTGVGLNWGFLTNNYLTQLDLSLQMGEASNQAKVISRPKVQVLDGQSANIQDGTTIAFQTVSADGTQTQLIPVVKSLNVSPRIFSDGRVQMTVTVTDNSVGTIVNGVASIDTRSATTVLIVKDGETAVIGGLMSESTLGSRQGIPGLMNIPILNTLFTGRNKSKDLTELLVFLTPTIIRRPPPAS